MTKPFLRYWKADIYKLLRKLVTLKNDIRNLKSNPPFKKAMLEDVDKITSVLNQKGKSSEK